MSFAISTRPTVDGHHLPFQKLCSMDKMVGDPLKVPTSPLQTCKFMDIEQVMFGSKINMVSGCRF